MIEESNIDFGAIHVHKEAIADIAVSALNEIEGVALIPRNLKDSFLEFFGKKGYSGVRIVIDKDHQVTIDLKITVKYGVNIPMVARQVQESVRVAVEKIADINIKDIHINVCGMERGKA